MPQAGDLKLDLEGAGPLSDWHGKLDLDAQNLATLSSTLDLAYTDHVGVGLEAHLTVDEQVLGSDVAELTGETIDLETTLDFRDPGLLKIAQLNLETAGPRLRAEGTVDLNQQQHDVSLSAQLDDLARASSLAKAPLAGSVSLDLKSTGALLEPKATLEIDGRGIAYDVFSLESLALALNADATKPVDSGAASGRATLDGTFVGLRQGDKPLLIDDKLTLHVAADVYDQKRVELEQLRIETGPASLDTQGDLDIKELAGSVNLTIDVPTLKPVVQTYAPDAAPDLDGTLRLDLPVAIESQFQQIRAELTFKARDLVGLPPGAAELVGSTADLTVNAEFSEQKAIEVSKLELTAAELSLSGKADANLESKDLSADLEARIADLSKLTSVAGTNLAGQVDLSVIASGTIDQPHTDLRVTASGLEAADQRFDTLTLTATQRGAVDQPHGTVGLTASVEDDELTLGGDYALKDDVATVENLVITAPQTRIEANAAYDLATSLANAEVEGSIENLDALKRWHGQNLEGRVLINAATTEDNGAQDVVLDLQTNGVVGDFGTIEQVILQGTVDAATTEPDVDLNLTLDTFSAPGAVVRDLTVKAEGLLSDLALAVTANGAAREIEIALDAQAQINAQSDVKSVVIQALDGTIGSKQLALAQPATVRVGGSDIEVSDFDLGFGDARLTADVGLTQQEARGDVRLSDLDLAMLEEFGAPALRGTLGLDVTSRGAPTAPVVNANATIASFAPDTADFDIESDIDLKVDYADRRLAADLKATGLSDDPASVTASLPVGLSLQPFAFELADDAPIEGQASLHTTLERISAIAAIEDQYLSGPLAIDLTFGGALDNPLVDGEVSLKNASIADSLSGAELRDVNIVLAANDNRIDIQQFEARDNRKGTIGAEGFVDLRDPASKDAFNVDLSIKQLLALDSDLGTALLSGDIDAGGSFQDLDITGKLKIDQADLQIPGGGGGPTINTLEVEEIYAPGEEPVETEAPSTPIRIGLDLAIDMANRIFIRGRGLDTEWGGALTITGDTAEPVISGQIEYRRGFLDLLGQRYQITEGTITFDGSSPPDPDINLVSQAQSEEILAIIKVTGRATDPEIELTSEPPLPQDEVISHLLFGKESSQLTPAQGVRLAIAVETLRGGGPDALGSLRQLVGLDTLSVSGESQDDAALTAGEYLTDRVYVEVERGVADNSGKARMEVELTPRLSVDTEVTEDAQTGVGLSWSYDY